MSRLKDSYAGCMECGGSMKMKKGGWIQKAVSKNPGSFTKQAQSAGMSVSGFRNKVLANKGDYSSTTVKRANLAKTLSKMRKGDKGMEVGIEPKKSFTLNPAIEEAMKTVPNKTNMTPVTSESGNWYTEEEWDNSVKNNPSSISSPSNSSIDKSSSNLVKGGTEKVAAYQRMLKAKGYNVDADGAWGKNTQAAHERYMKSTKQPSSSNKPWTWTPEEWDKSVGTTPTTSSNSSSKGKSLSPKPTMGPMPYNSKFGRVPVPKPQYTDLYPTGDNSTGKVKMTDYPTQNDSAQYRELFNSMLKNDPSSIREYQHYKKHGIPGGISPEALFNMHNRMNAYEDAMTHKRKMMMGGSIPGVNGSVIGPAVPMSKTGQSFPRRNAGTSKLAKFKKK